MALPSEPCPDCGFIGTHVCVPCKDEADIASFREICGDIDPVGNHPVIYYINPEQAAAVDASMSEIYEALGELDPERLDQDVDK